MIAETPFWKHEVDRFIQFQENVNNNFTIKKRNCFIELKSKINRPIGENFKLFLRFTA